MLQAAHTRLLNSNNFVVLGDVDKVYNTEPSGLKSLIDGLDTRQSNRLIDYVTIANYCKSLILNPNITSFDLDVEDILKIWENRILCLFIISITGKLGYGKEIVNDKMLKFEANNMLKQAAILDNPKPMSPSRNILIKQNTVKVDKMTILLLMWIKHSGQGTPLVEYLYEEVFVARYERDQEYLQRLKYGIIAVLLKRGELLSVQSLLKDETTIAELIEKVSMMKVVGHCFGKCIKSSRDEDDKQQQQQEEEEDEEDEEEDNNSYSNSRDKLVKALIGVLTRSPHT